LFWEIEVKEFVMSWNEFLVSLGARGSSSIRHMPKQLARMAAEALQNPVTPTAAVGYIADFQIDVPASELAANARVLNLSQGLVTNHDLATNIRRPKTAGDADSINCDYVFADGAWQGIAQVETSRSDPIGPKESA
jgi:hypothetical protein